MSFQKFFLAVFIQSIVIGAFSPLAFAQIENSEQNFLESKALLKKIQNENDFRRGTFDFKMGLLQVSQNKQEDPLKLNSRGQMPFLQIDTNLQIWNRWGLALSYQQAMNMLSSGEPPNTTSSSQQVYQIGVLYKYILDETSIKNHYILKLQYYGMSNDFILTDNANLFYSKSQTGILLGVERSIPATELFDLRGGLDIVFVQDTKTNSTIDFKKEGTGLQFKTELLYNLSKTSYLGLGYSISAFFNKYVDPGFESRSTHTQTYKGLYFSYSMLF